MQTPFDSNVATPAPLSAPSPPATVASAADLARQDLQARWKQLVAPAQLRWSKLTEAELHKTAGNEHQLAVLVQGRYRIPRGDAYRQVQSFHDSQKV
jgi:hypothetical protein